MEVPTAVPKSQRSPRLKLASPRQVPKMKKDKDMKTLLVHESPRKHQRKKNSAAQEKGKVVDLEADKGQMRVERKLILSE